MVKNQKHSHHIPTVVTISGKGRAQERQIIRKEAKGTLWKPVPRVC